MSSARLLTRTVVALACLGLSLPGWAGEGAAEFGLTVKYNVPLGDFRTETLGGVKFGVGAGLRAHFKLHPQHYLTARADYDYYPPGNTEVVGDVWSMQRTIKVQEAALGLTYEWHYTGTAKGGFLFVGPVYRRWNYHLDELYIQTRPAASIPSNQSYDASPSRLGLDCGWGWQNGAGSVIEFHLITSTFGETNMPANTLQFTFTQYW